MKITILQVLENYFIDKTISVVEMSFKTKNNLTGSTYEYVRQYLPKKKKDLLLIDFLRKDLKEKYKKAIPFEYTEYNTTYFNFNIELINKQIKGIGMYKNKFLIEFNDIKKHDELMQVKLTDLIELINE